MEDVITLFDPIATITGPGVVLYFYFVRTVALFCLLASILHIPHILFAYSGQMLDAYKISPSTAGYFMAANHMVMYPGSNTTKWCDGESVNTIFQPHVSCSEPVIQLFNSRSKVYIKASHASYVTTACDVFTCLLFIATWLFLIGVHDSLKDKKPIEVVSSQEYAIQVKGLPPDATEEEIVAHFNGLYAINGAEDWTYRGDCCGSINAKTFKRNPKTIIDIAGKVIGKQMINERCSYPSVLNGLSLCTVLLFLQRPIKALG